MYAKIQNNKIIKTGSRPAWYYPKNHPDYPGEKITDDSVYIQGGLVPDENSIGWYPVSDEEKPVHDPVIEYAPKLKPKSDWKIESNQVVQVWEAPIAKTLDIIKKEICTEINNKRDSMQSHSLEYTFPDGKKGHIQRRNQKDERNIQGVASAALSLVLVKNTVDKVHFTDEENIKHFLTGAQGITFGTFVQMNYAKSQDNARQHKDKVNALTTVKEVQNYDYSSGWV